MTSAAEADQAIHRGASASARLYTYPSLDPLDFHDAAAWQPIHEALDCSVSELFFDLGDLGAHAVGALGIVPGRSGRDGMVFGKCDAKGDDRAVGIT